MIPHTQLAHVKIRQFGEHVSSELRQVINVAGAQGAHGMIIDLRDNPGGLRDEAVAVASQFVGDGTILTQQDADGHLTVFSATPGGREGRVGARC